MAQLLYKRDATRKHLSATRRHMRLCRQFNGTQFLLEQIQLPYNELKTKEAATAKKEELREDRYDDLLIADNHLDDLVRNVFRRCEEHDRSMPTEAVLHRIFPEGGFSQIVNMNREQEPDVVERIALRLEALGKEHALFPLAAELRRQVAASRKVIKAYEEVMQQIKTCQAEEEIARGTLRRQYENNYLDARKQLGKKQAERLFPRLNPTSRTSKTAEAAESSPETV